MRILRHSLFCLLLAFGTANAGLIDIVTKGSVDRSVPLHIADLTDGSPENAVVFNTSGIDLWYRREGGARVAITEATLAALTTAHTDGGFLYVSDGEYRLDLPDAAFATGANYVDVGGTVTGMVVYGGRVRLVDYSLEDAVRGTAGTALPNAAAGASGGALINGSNSGTVTLAALTVSGATTLTGNVAMSNGLTITQATTNGNGVSVTGNGTGSGILATGGATGHGINGVGGSTSGNGLRAAGTAGNSAAANLVGQGSAAGLLSTGGATGAGASFVGGSTSGVGLLASGTAGNSAAMSLVGQGSGSGLLAAGGATGHGMRLNGGATSGMGLSTSITNPSGAVPGFGIQDSGTFQSATSTTAVLAATTSFTTDNPNGMTLEIIGGTGVGQSRPLAGWNNTTKAATVATWITTPDNTSDYILWGTAASSGGGGSGDWTTDQKTAISAILGIPGSGTTPADPTTGILDTIRDYIDTEMAAVKTKTDFLPSATAGSNGGLPTVNASNQIVGLQVFDEDTTTMDVNATPVGAAASVTAGVTVTTNSDKTGYSLGASGLGSATWPTAWDPEVQSEVDDALVARFLDQLIATAYNSASPPGNSGSLLRAITENDGGTPRFTVNALEQAPAGGGGGGTDFTVDERTAMKAILGVPASGTTPEAPSTGVLAIVRDRIGSPSNLGSGASLAANNADIEGQTDDIGVAGAGLSAQPWNSSWDAEVQSEVTDALNALTIAEPVGVPAWNAPIAAWIAYIGAWHRNEVNQTSSTKTLRNDADSGNIASCAVSDDGTTFVQAECN